MAGIDPDHGGDTLGRRGTARASACSSRSPSSIPEQGTCGNVEEGRRRDRRRCSTASTSWPPTIRDGRDRREFSGPAGEDRRRRRVEPRHRARLRDGRAALPAGDQVDVTSCRAASAAASRCAGSCWRQARPAAARRADEPPRRRVGRVARAHLAEHTPGRRRRGHHDRYFLDNVAQLDPRARPRQGHPGTGELTGWLEQKQKRLEQGGAKEASQTHARRELEWVRQNPKGDRRRTRPPQATTRLRRARGAEREARPGRDPHPGRAPLGDHSSSRPTACARLRRPLLIEDLVLAAARRDRRRDRRQRRGQDHALPHDHRPGAAGDAGALRVGDTVELAYVDQSRDARRPRRPSGRRSRTAGEVPRSATARMNSRRLRRASFNFKGSTSRRRSALRRRAQPPPPRQGAPKAAATSCCSTSRRTTSTSTPCARSRRRCSASPAAVIISRPRWFLDRVAALTFEGDSRVTWFEGSGPARAPPRAARPAARPTAPAGSAGQPPG